MGEEGQGGWEWGGHRHSHTQKYVDVHAHSSMREKAKTQKTTKQNSQARAYTPQRLVKRL